VVLTTFVYVHVSILNVSKALIKQALPFLIEFEFLERRFLISDSQKSKEVEDIVPPESW
jgi:hypothetical protein